MWGLLGSVFALAFLNPKGELWLLSDNPGGEKRTFLGCSYTLSRQPDYWNKPFTGRELLDGGASSTSDSVAWRGGPPVDIDFPLPGSFLIEKVVVRFYHFTHGYRIDFLEVFVSDDPKHFGEPAGKVDNLAGLGAGAHRIVVRVEGKKGKFVRLRASSKGLMTLGEVEIWGWATEKEIKEARFRRGVWKFDFGPNWAAPFPPDFIPVNDRLVYTLDRGFGWAEARHLGTVYNDLPDDLFGDLIWGPEDKAGEFWVDLPPGNYGVCVFLGDLHGIVKCNWMEVEVNGERLRTDFVREPEEGVWTEERWPTLRMVMLRAEIKEERLRVKVKGSPCWAWCGLLIGRGGKAKEATEVLDLLRRQREERKEFKRVRARREEEEAREPSPEEKKRGYTVFSHPHSFRILPNTPILKGATQSLKAFAALGEYEPLTFSVKAIKSLFGLRVHVNDLSGPGGRTLPSNCFDVRMVRFWPQRVGSSWGKDYDIVSEVLDPIGPHGISIPPGVTQEFWLTVKVPDESVPGVYKGKVTLHLYNLPSVILPLELRILPFRLPELKDWFTGVYFRYPPIPPQDVEAQLHDLREHGVRAVALLLGPSPMVREGKVYLDFSRLDELISLLKKYGLTCPIPLHWAWCPEEQQYVESVRQIMEHARKMGWPEILFYPVDEPGRDMEKIKRCQKLLQLAKRVPGAKTYVTCNGQGFEIPYLDPWMDVRCYQLPSFTPDQQEDTIRKGDRLYFYYGPIGEDPKDARLVNGFFYWRTGATGLYYWHYQFVCGSPWTDFDTPTRDWCAVYPGKGKPLPTVAWEGVREGIDDLRYVQLLQEAIKRAKDRRLASKAQEVLDEIWDSIDPSGPNFWGKIEITPEEFKCSGMMTKIKPHQFDQWRRDLASWAVRLLRGTSS